VVAGSWKLNGSIVQISWFSEAGRPPRTALEEETARLSALLGRPLHAAIGLA
jgi:hypothetical protein